MFDQYLVAGDGDVLEYRRCVPLISGMVDAVDRLAPARHGTLVHGIDIAFAGAPEGAVPSSLLRNAIEHALRNLQYVGMVVTQEGTQVSVPALMGCIRIALLSASHLCYVVSAADLPAAIQRMGGLYKLEIDSAVKFINQMDASSPESHGLPDLCPSPDSAIRRFVHYANPHSPAGRLSESALLSHMKDSVLAPLLQQLSIDGATGSLLVDHLFNTASGAAHGYAWIDLPGVVAHFVPQFSVATAVANIVFNDYLCALGQHPNQAGSSV